MLKSFFGPFVLTTVVATFILLVQYMLKYFDDFVGKDLGFMVFGELIFYFSLNMLQVALPLGVLVSSLMTFGNLGENFELSAIKSAGISLTRVLLPIFCFVVVLSFGAFFFNDYVVPAANLKAYSLLYDIKHKKPALDIKKGVFYNGIPNYSIKANEKFSDNKSLKDVMIYDHTKKEGNNFLIIADSCRMYTIHDDNFLKLELYKGNYFYQEPTKSNKVDQFQRTGFDRLEMVFSLSSFDLKRTQEEYFQNNRQMKNISELTVDIDSLIIEQNLVVSGNFKIAKDYLYHRFGRADYGAEKIKSDSIQSDSTMYDSAFFVVDKDTIGRANLISAFSWDSLVIEDKPLTTRQEAIKNRGGNYLLPENRMSQIGFMELSDFDSLFISNRQKSLIVQWALSQSRTHKVSVSSSKSRMENLRLETDRYKIEKYKKYSQALACIVMFLIGAPLGAIIKKGGLGVPVIISIFFFIIYYVVTILSEKWAKAGFIDGAYAVWSADIILLPIGLFFLRQARVDARLFDADFYRVVLDKFRHKISSK